MNKLAVLSNINIDPLKNQLQKNSSYELYFAGYNQWQSELLNLNSKLYDFCPDFVFIYLNAEEFKADIQLLFLAVNFYQNASPTCRFLISNFTLPPFTVETYKVARRVDREFNESLVSYSKDHKNIFILDFERLVLLHGYTSMFDDKYWYLGRIKFRNSAFAILAEEINNVLNCMQGKVKKVLILDLDNTLWGGVVGEDGWQGLQLVEEGVGRIYKDFQRLIKQLTSLGFVLAICSKNNESDAVEVFDNNAEMVLGLDDFVIRKINWTSKSENIVEIAQTLNIGLDSLVFIDDSAVERELVKRELPELIVPDFPTDITKLPSWFILSVVYPYFSKTELTLEDGDKTAQYKRNALRESEKQKTSFDNFLRDLNIKLDVRIADQSIYKRVAQLSQKTNQFNLSLKRYSESEIELMCDKQGFIAITCSYEDKYGSEGIVGCALIELKNKKLLIDSFMISCRVLGRKVDELFLADILQIAKKKMSECEVIEANYLQTAKNELVKEFLQRCNFISVDNVLFSRKI